MNDDLGSNVLRHCDGKDYIGRDNGESHISEFKREVFRGWIGDSTCATLKSGQLGHGKRKDTMEDFPLEVVD